MARVGTVGLALLLGVCATGAHAAPSVTPAVYGARLAQAATLAGSCAAAAPACDAAKVGDDLQVEPGGYAVHLGWLRSTLQAARGASPQARARLMREASSRLQQEQGFLDPPSKTDAQADAQADSLARRRADSILDRREFRRVDRAPSWWQLLEARFWAWLERVLMGAARASAARPWVGIAVEWALLAGALMGLLVYAFRALSNERGFLRANWQLQAVDLSPASEDWAARARLAAAARQWREAVHALYWAAINSLADAGRWRAAAGLARRTPREYLRLLEPASPERASLARLTLLLERTWYARLEAGEPDYALALALVEQLAPPQTAYRAMTKKAGGR